MPATYTEGSSTDRNLVRLLIADTDITNALLQDAEIDALVVLEDNLYFAAAQALEVIATSEVLVLKKVRLLAGDISTDGPAVAKVLRERAAQLRSQGSSLDGGFEIVELNLDHFTNAQLRFNNVLKGVT